MRLLLIEDDEVDRMAFERFVLGEQLPYDYDVADSVARARGLIAQNEYDVILLDFNLGDGTGFDIIELHPDAPIVLITGANQIDIAVNAMKAGAFDYLVKDLERDYLRMLPLAVDQAIRAKEAEDTFRVLSHALMSATDSTFITDLDGKIEFVNSAVTETYGYTEKELLEKDISMIGETAADGEYYHKRSNGEEFPVSLSRSTVKDDAGRGIAIVVLARDITERKKAEEELRRINEELEGYAHTVSHDLKGPLASTVLAVGTLQKILTQKGLADEKMIANMLKILDNNVWKSSALIDDLLSLAEAGQMPDEFTEVDVDATVDRVLEENSGAIQERHIKVERDGAMGKVTGSPVHIYQLFANLIRNCINHCDSPNPLLSIEHSGEAGGLHEYLVRDNGSGIPPADLGKIFAPFFKGKSGGTGIGLATVEKIVKLYGGTIRAYNDNGACFEFGIHDLG